MKEGWETEFGLNFTKVYGETELVVHSTAEHSGGVLALKCHLVDGTCTPPDLRSTASQASM